MTRGILRKRSTAHWPRYRGPDGASALRRQAVPAAAGPGPRTIHGHEVVAASTSGPEDPMTAATSAGTRAEHPVVTKMRTHRANDLQLRLADAITRFAGSMGFVYLHIVWFAGWMVFLEGTPWPTLTLVVSLEAIFLSTFVMIGQNRAAIFQQAKADHDFNEQELELKTNTQLTREIHALTTEMEKRLSRPTGS